MWRYELHPPHLTKVATIPCENQNTKNVILQRPRDLNLPIWGVIQQCVHETIHEADVLRKRLMQTDQWRDRLTSCVHLVVDKFQRVLRLGSVTVRHLVVGVSQTLRRWTEGATYVRQRDHHVGHWPTFLVSTNLVLRSTRIWKRLYYVVEHIILRIYLTKLLCHYIKFRCNQSIFACRSYIYQS